MTKLTTLTEKTKSQVEVLDYTLELFHVNLKLGLGQRITHLQIDHKIVEQWARLNGYLTIIHQPIDQFDKLTTTDIDLETYLEINFDFDAALSLANHALVLNSLLEHVNQILNEKV